MSELGIIPNMAADISGIIEIEVKYEGYIKRQKEEAENFKRIEGVRIPEDISYDNIPGLSTEVKGLFNRIRPVSIGQAGRIPGATPAAISMLMIHLRRQTSVG
jgi:tRNA uridine 5-carboxymethylaminomethyl modification enzyme